MKKAKSDPKTAQVFSACFVGGAMFVLVALLVPTSQLYWAFVAGLASGYLSFELKVVIANFPEAWRRTRWIIGAKFTDFFEIALPNLARALVGATKRFFAKPHPRGYSSLGPALIILIVLLTKEGALIFFFGNDVVEANGEFPLAFVTSLITFLVLYVFISTMVWLGGHSSQEISKSGFLSRNEPNDIWVRCRLAKGHELVDYNYANAGRWFALGLWSIVKTIVWTVPKMIIVFLWQLISLVHSHERVLCALDGVIGGFVAFQFFVSPDSVWGVKLAAVLLGGLLGGIWGVANYKAFPYIQAFLGRLRLSRI